MPSQTQTRPGSRVVVSDTDMTEELGYGTFIEDGIVIVEGMGALLTPSILLDSGKVVFGFQTYWAEIRAEPAPQMEVTVSSAVRLFRTANGLQIVHCEQYLAPDTTLTIAALEQKLYDHRLQLAARIAQDGEALYFLVCEGGLPRHYTEEPESVSEIGTA